MTEEEAEKIREICEEIFFYNPDTGILTNKETRAVNSLKGDETGYLNKVGYRQTIVNGGLQRTHRIAYLMTYGYLPKCIDHINGIRDDNRIINLRSCTMSQNNMNRSSLCGSSSKYKGVSWDPKNNKWISRIKLLGKHIWIGRFKDEVDAAKAYNKKASELHGEFAYLNEVD